MMLRQRSEEKPYIEMHAPYNTTPKHSRNLALKIK